MAAEETFNQYSMGDDVFMPIQDFTETNPTDMSCVFCDPPEETVSPFELSQPLGAGNIAAKAALGMLMPGYMLTVSQRHITSFGQLEPDALREVDTTLTEYEYDNQRFGQYLRFEHGSDGIDHCSAGAGACIDHAHQHLIPAPDVAEYILSKDHPDKDKLDWQQLDTFENIIDLRGTPYMYMGYAGMHYVVENPGVPSQWIRRLVTKLHPEHVPNGNWDWFSDPGTNQLMLTLLNQLRSGLPIARGRYYTVDGQAIFEPYGNRLRGLK
jgi:diadenosine tetraphosphate (Ap4A) HIT family hydrolase